MELTSMDVVRFISEINYSIMGVDGKVILVSDKYNDIHPKTTTVCVHVDAGFLNNGASPANRKKIKPAATLYSKYAKKLGLEQKIKTYFHNAQLCIDKLFTSACTVCSKNNPENIKHSYNDVNTSSNGDQPLCIISKRFVPLDEETTVLQEGTYYEKIFVPKYTGDKLLWSTHIGCPPMVITAKLCCLLNALISFKSESEGPIKELQILSFPTNKEQKGPLLTNFILDTELNSKHPVLVLLVLNQ
uniref:Wsv267-like protein n=1 Tax=Pasiphaea japonica whispovirus TaxID=2984286 RepID=A0A9C7CGC5_9VIRU|nr:MAG: wsv267-like protein [Pasiphaea japonica whispovirus]